MSNKLLVGRYELIEKIGEGGMAVVYKSKDRLLNRFVAIKILRPEYTKDSQFVDSFRKESQAVAGLQYSNIISVYDVGHEGNIHFARASTAGCSGWTKIARAAPAQRSPPTNFHCRGESTVSPRNRRTVVRPSAARSSTCT